LLAEGLAQRLLDASRRALIRQALRRDAYSGGQGSLFIESDRAARAPVKMVERRLAGRGFNQLSARQTDNDRLEFLTFHAKHLLGSVSSEA
jgi:hypothetical protein